MYTIASFHGKSQDFLGNFPWRSISTSRRLKVSAATAGVSGVEQKRCPRKIEVKVENSTEQWPVDPGYSLHMGEYTTQLHGDVFLCMFIDFFHPETWGPRIHLDDFFQMGWKHQLVKHIRWIWMDDQQKGCLFLNKFIKYLFILLVEFEASKHFLRRYDWIKTYLKTPPPKIYRSISSGCACYSFHVVFPTLHICFTFTTLGRGVETQKPKDEVWYFWTRENKQLSFNAAGKIRFHPIMS